ncbi:Clan SC, family S28, unassigned serine peptidase [Histomonas meleagridis]|uniref:Clan SC, family S28, unassigned serine peptidase n=1 Tax=Histomonas meleagridis TaxID=135588 RepID=UPI0035595F3B|nr:Clan SC, family S28, unassigned serine peptidase [Histomonas meleagridis]KAH0805067.1 Clan SC, family S28, unassigned serine peptidase [Histomonas meleagridis]
MFLCLFYFINAFTESTFEQLIDHFNTESNLKFDQRVIIETRHAKVKYQTLIIYLTGFESIDIGRPFPSSLDEIANKTSATLIAIESRYFGKSYPYESLTTENLRYNTIEQNLADLANIIKYLKNLYEVKKVIIVGKGYGGSIATWFRLHYPNYVDAVWASSAPLSLISYNDQIDKNIISKLTSQSQNCYDATVSLMKRFEAIFTYGDSQSQIRVKRSFGFAESANSNSFLYEVAELFGLMARTETNRSTHLLTEYCIGQKFEPNEESLIYMFKKTLNQYGMNVNSFDPQTAASATCDVKDMRSLLYIKCNQIGSFNVYNSQYYLRSRSLNETYYNNLCSTAFQIDKVAPNINSFNILNGNLEKGASSTILSQSTIDIESERFHFVDNIENDFIIKSTSEELYNDELYTLIGNETQEISTFRSGIISIIENWADSIRNEKCSQHGTIVMNKCKCFDSWTGELCQTKTISSRMFKMISSVATLFPTIILLSFALLAWKKLFNDSKIDTRPSAF